VIQLFTALDLYIHAILGIIAGSAYSHHECRVPPPPNPGIGRHASIVFSSMQVFMRDIQ
jgi:hypothetical protein